MNCPHCGRAIETKKKSSESVFWKDVARAEAAIAVLQRCPIPELREACDAEIDRLFAFISAPAKLYTVYRRADKKTPYAYGMAT